MLAVKPFIRWYCESIDFPAIQAIEDAAWGEEAWAEDEFRLIAGGNCGMKVAIVDAKVVGYICWTFHGRTFAVENVTTHPSWERKGIARSLVEDLVEIAQRREKKRLRAVIHEENLDALMFFKACGFTSSKLCRDYFYDGRDAIKMQREW